jgi:hypothetical protein
VGHTVDIADDLPEHFAADIATTFLAMAGSVMHSTISTTHYFYDYDMHLPFGHNLALQPQWTLNLR